MNKPEAKLTMVQLTAREVAWIAEGYWLSCYVKKRLYLKAKVLVPLVLGFLSMLPTAVILARASSSATPSITTIILVVLTFGFFSAGLYFYGKDRSRFIARCVDNWKSSGVMPKQEDVVAFAKAAQKGAQNG